MTVEYRTTMHLTGRNTGIPVPPEVLEALGGGKRPAVAVVANGYRFTSTVGAMGGRALIPFSAERRAESGIAGGDDLAVLLELDTAPREAAVPDDLAAALAAAGVRDAFDALAPSRRKAHVTAVEGAKAPETRARRVAAAVESLRA
ncbi:YdeI/OmpD-associated family protein [uncultured Amnibacterium sp.]|uniref:YdeI/OmpD-associated family protein n=1 Tax=uncultured Amnibacterium sp. TaxID=1631851 RepID=UPI0035CA7E95